MPVIPFGQCKSCKSAFLFFIILTPGQYHWCEKGDKVNVISLRHDSDGIYWRDVRHINNKSEHTDGGMMGQDLTTDIITHN